MKQIFSKETYKEWEMRVYGYDRQFTWVDKADGHEVVDGLTNDGFKIDPEWIETIYEVGDYVKLKNERGAAWNDDGLMDKYIGAVVKIEEIGSFYFYAESAVSPWGENWYWAFSCSDVERPATAEEIEEYEKKRIKTNDNKKISVVITFDGLVTRADLVRNDTCETVKTAEARCNPADVYSRSEGARIAVERLFEKKQK